MPEQTTVDDVIRHVAATEGWYVTFGCIRRHVPSGDACPISSIDNRPDNEWVEVAQAHHIDADLADAIIEAADDQSCWCLEHDGEEIEHIRRRLLDAAKLTEDDNA